MKPLLEMDMRLGEGSGAAAAIPLVTMAVRVLTDMATFADAGVSGRDEAAPETTAPETATPETAAPETAAAEPGAAIEADATPPAEG